MSTVYITNTITPQTVNNVGVMLPHPMEFELASERDIWAHINVNMATVPVMTKLVLPGMLSRGRGAIINLSSIASTFPIPLMGIYAATKVCVVPELCFGLVLLLNQFALYTVHLSAIGSLSLILCVLLLLLQVFVDFFSQALEWEYRGSGITVQTITPGYVSTNMLKFSELVHRQGGYGAVFVHIHSYIQMLCVLYLP